jgi:hypothetical protein
VGAVKELTGRARRTASSARAKARGGGKGGNGSAGPQGHTTSAPHEGDNGVANWQWQCCCLLYSARAGQWQWGALSRAAAPRSSPPPSMPSGHVSALLPSLSPSLCPCRLLLLLLTLASLPFLVGHSTHHAGRVGMAEISIKECKELCSPAKPSLAYDFSHGACNIV